MCETALFFQNDVWQATLRKTMRCALYVITTASSVLLKVHILTTNLKNSQVKIHLV